MNILDLVLSVVLSGFIYKGYKRGCVEILASLLAIVIGVWGAYALYEPLSAYLMKLSAFEEKSLVMLRVVSFLGLFIVGHLSVRILGDKTRKGLQLLYLHWLDRMLGGILGFVKGGVLLGVVVFVAEKILTIIPFGVPESLFQESFFATSLHAYTDQIVTALVELFERFSGKDT